MYMLFDCPLLTLFSFIMILRVNWYDLNINYSNQKIAQCG